MKKIVIIAVYYGEFPKHYRLLLKSIEKNLTIDYKIFTDQNIKSNLSNLEYINLPLKELDILVKEKLGQDFGINRPYKCCDFKPVYGILFEDYIKNYDFWGHCDLDLIFGNIRKFVTDDILEEYDKVLPLGHLSIYRNTNEVNNRYKDDGVLRGNYQEAFSSNRSFGFDEWNGIMGIYYQNHYPFYDKRVFADISILRKRFTLALGDKNYKHQAFYWEDGHVYRAYVDENMVKKDEFIYIHFKQRKYLDDKVKSKKIDGFYICDDGFVSKKKGLPTAEDIRVISPYHGAMYEFIEAKLTNLRFFIKRVKRKIA